MKLVMCEDCAQWRGFFYVAQEPDNRECCETGPTVFVLIRED